MSRPSFAELLAMPGVVEECELRGRVGFMAYHGGGLEEMTDVIARTAAEQSGSSYYGVVHPPDWTLHLPSTRVTPDDSERLAGFLEHVDIVVTIHGFGRRPLLTSVLLGGRNRELAAHVAGHLRSHLPAYDIVDDLDDIPTELRGVHERNPVNLPRSGGVQIELPPRIRGSSPLWWDWEGDLVPHTRSLIDRVDRRRPRPDRRFVLRLAPHLSTPRRQSGGPGGYGDRVHRDRRLLEERMTRELYERVLPLVERDTPLLRSPRARRPDEQEPFEVGTMWGPPWGTTWFTFDGDVPATWAGGLRRGRRSTSGSAATRWASSAKGSSSTSTGRPVQGIHPRRTRHRIDADARAGDDPARGGVEPVVPAVRPVAAGDPDTAGETAAVPVPSTPDLVLVDDARPRRSSTTSTCSTT